MADINSISKLGIGTPLFLITIMAMMVIPLPAFVLDILFTFNIALSLIVILVTIYVRRPLDFVIFPTVILLTTLFRLSLNIASTRIVLIEGHNGGDAAGKVIEAFGAFVIGGNYAVGIVVFAILVIINFVVVTKGAGRVSEVSARFTLDAMPGKQMAIDADLNAGLLTQEEAGERRQDISREAGFYGAMDGSTKFVRGDAIAGILILFINMIGGLAIGMIQHDLSFDMALQYYITLTIGDGLVAQIPSLLLSSGTAIIITRVSSEMDMSGEVISQMTEDPRVLGITSGIIAILGLIPGMPHFSFLLLAGLIGAGAFWAYKQQEEKEKSALLPPSTDDETEESEEQRDLSWDDVKPVDVISLEVGYRLIPIVDKNQGGQLLSRIKGVRKKLSQELGYLVQAIHIKDNLDLGPNNYQIKLMGVPIGEAEVHPEKELAINPGQVYGELTGLKTKDPAFNLDAVWIDPSLRDHAQTQGYTIVDTSTVVATHISKIIQEHAQELLGSEEVQKLLDLLAESAPKLVEDLVPKTLSLVTVRRVLQNLLSEKIPISDMRSIAETLAEVGPTSQDPVALTAAVRASLGRSITQNIYGMKDELSIMTFDPELEQLLHEASQTSVDGSLNLEPGLAETIFTSLAENITRLEAASEPAVLLTAPNLRLSLSKLLRPSMPDLNILAYNELPEHKQIKIVATIGRG